ncbi:response regulator [Halorarius litoreus]|uniref:response regulator n=1 Tax=Halorarius litoreus TaxID=2962676 RepID=UPI0020CCC9FC|nr:response regulator [Halorarius litoreus]
MGEEQATVLVVEDEPALVDIYTHWLSDTYTVLTANGGEEALEQLSDSVDVALLDRLMPGMAGEEVLAAIRVRSVQCRVAMVTAVEPDFDILEMGFDDYLTKPVSKDQLLETVERLLARGSFAEMERELYSLASKRALLETTKSRSELQRSEEYQQLQTRMTELREELDTSMPEMGNGEFVAMVRELQDGAESGDSE